MVLIQFVNSQKSLLWILQKFQVRKDFIQSTFHSRLYLKKVETEIIHSILHIKGLLIFPICEI